MVGEAVRLHAQLLMDRVEVIEKARRVASRPLALAEENDDDPLLGLAPPPQRVSLADDLSSDDEEEGNDEEGQEEEEEDARHHSSFTATSTRSVEDDERAWNPWRRRRKVPTTMVDKEQQKKDSPGMGSWPPKTPASAASTATASTVSSSFSSTSSFLHSHHANVSPHDEIEHYRTALAECQQAVVDLNNSHDIKVEQLELQVLAWQRRALRAEGELAQQQQLVSPAPNSKTGGQEKDSSCVSNPQQKHLREENYRLQQLLLRRRCEACQERTSSLGSIQKQLFASSPEEPHEQEQDNVCTEPVTPPLTCKPRAIYTKGNHHDRAASITPPRTSTVNAPKSLNTTTQSSVLTLPSSHITTTQTFITGGILHTNARLLLLHQYSQQEQGDTPAAAISPPRRRLPKEDSTNPFGSEPSVPAAAVPQEDDSSTTPTRPAAAAVHKTPTTPPVASILQANARQLWQRETRNLQN